MKEIYKYLLNGLKYLVIQGITEIVLIVTLEYSGFKILTDFSSTNLFIENIEAVVWSISMKTAMFCLFYLPLFVGISALLTWKNITNILKYSIINAFLNALLFMVYFALRNANFSEIANLFIATLLASTLIIITVKVMENKKRQAA
jgi:hypothetical protein